MKNISRNVRLLCSVCGNDQFSSIDESVEDINDAPDDTKIKCSDCGRVITKEELLEENSELINANLDDFEKEALKEIEKEIKKIFK
jgi:ribosomal protein S27E